MIETISVRNFRSLRDLRVRLERFTVFVGPNGSGKSSVLQALDALCRAFHFVPDNGEIYQALSRGAKGPVEITAHATDMWYRHRSQIVEHNGAITALPALEAASQIDSAAWRPWPAEENQHIPLPKAVLLRLAAHNLMSSSFNPADNTTISPDGIGLHAALASMALNEPDTWQVFQNDVKGIIPTIRRLRHAKMASGQVPALQFDMVGADSLGADQMSEGTLLVLGLLTALYAPDRPNLILLDDLDRGLHPKAQQDVIALLRRLLDRNPDLQLVATTHSPYLLNWMQPEEVRMTCLREDGSTVCAPIGTHPQFNKWKDEMAPGEMWSLFGERWLVEQGAAV
jgi:predicted ATPase